jgi:HPt (histidine-containing phosphotransfer) domain-containing protein
MIEPHSAPASTPVRSLFADDGEWDELLRAFAETIPQKRQALRDWHHGGAVDQIRLLAHQVKGAGGGYGFPELSQVAAALEQACQSNNADRVAQAVDDLIDYLDRIEV